ncbi:MAG: hypothetical protein K2L84_00605 [Muribaculaceae bacterium]|nr:hypothetical protein [Muribaculaceae bacterium]
MKKLQCIPLLFSVCLMAGSTACVDHDYDLSEDIDLTVKFGETLTLPASSTEELSFKKILDLESGSSIKAVERDGEYGLKAGDYVLVQNGNSEAATIEIGTVEIDNLRGESASSALDPFIVGTDALITVAASPTFNAINISDDNVTDEIVQVDAADLDIVIQFSVGYSSQNFNGVAYINAGYTATFDDSWTVELAGTSAAAYLEMLDAHTARFTRECEVWPGNPFVADMRLTHVDCTQLPAGQGLYAPGHFKLSSQIESKGNISIQASDVTGNIANLTLETSTSVKNADILAVTGIVNPRIDISPVSFEINDIPEFLEAEGNNLDIQNPQIHFTLTNTAPVTLDVNGMLLAHYASKPEFNVGLGEKYGTAPIVVMPGATTNYVVSREPVSIAGVQNIVVPELGALMSTVPEEIMFEDITAQVRQEPVTFSLGTSYSYNCDYEAVAPLAFGKDMRLEYSTDQADWDSDLDKYNFNKIRVELSVTNTIPMEMVPAVEAIDRAGNVIPDITAIVDGVVGAGMIDSSGVSELVITLESRAANLGNLDGVRINFTGTTPEEFVGVNLNENQSLRFSDIKITILGGITIDLND